MVEVVKEDQTESEEEDLAVVEDQAEAKVEELIRAEVVVGE